jgi:hypothetical protein
MITKGNIVRSKNHDSAGIVLALTKDGKRAKVYVYGPDAEVWRPVASFTVETAGTQECWKCQGSGIYYISGATVNGVFQGSTGPCFGCEGDGKQTDADRLRCHYYWHRRSDSIDATDLLPVGEKPAPAVETPAERPSMRTVVQRKRTARKAVHDDRGDGIELVNCQGCGTLHRNDVPCL